MKKYQIEFHDDKGRICWITTEIEDGMEDTLITVFNKLILKPGVTIHLKDLKND